MDLSSGRIPNFFILIGLMYGVFYRLCICGEHNIPALILGFVLPIVILFPLYMIRGMGAGDIKLLAMLGMFVSLKDLALIFILSVLIGAAAGVFKLILHRGVKDRIRYIGNIIQTVLGLKGNGDDSGAVLKLKDNPGAAVIHFSVPILASTVLVQMRHYFIFLGGL